MENNKKKDQWVYESLILKSCQPKIYNSSKLNRNKDIILNKPKLL